MIFYSFISLLEKRRGGEKIEKKSDDDIEDEEKETTIRSMIKANILRLKSKN